MTIKVFFNRDVTGFQKDGTSFFEHDFCIFSTPGKTRATRHYDNGKRSRRPYCSVCQHHLVGVGLFNGIRDVTRNEDKFRH